jgi:membrane-associated phospholipid phosphatase
VLVRLRAVQARVLPQGWLDVLRQLLLFGAAYLAYSVVRGLVQGRAGAAFQHARELIQAERSLHMFIEPSVQGWLSGSHLVMDLLSWIYVNAQTSVTVAALVFLYVRYNRSFYFVRNMLMIAMVLALIGYTIFPTAPPRFLPEWGFVDSVSDFAKVRLELAHNAGGATTTLTNIYAAVPSMHVAFALLIAWPLARLVRPRALRVLWALYPFVIAFVIIATANHFLLDAVLGALTAATSAYCAHWLARARPRVWRFSPASTGLEASA